MVEGHALFGRRVIYTDAAEINIGNVAEVVTKAAAVHAQNAGEIDYLYNYYKGKQPILKRVKDIRPEICNKIVVNRANEIVTFKSSYLVGEPVQYVNRVGASASGDSIQQLNWYMAGEDKDSKDEELADWMHICGTAYRMASPNKQHDCADESPFHIYTLDPRNTFVVYYSGLGNKPMLAVTTVLTPDSKVLYSCYTDTEYFEVVDGVVSKREANVIGMVPIVEYPLNQARLGAFEIVIDLLDAINETAANRMDGVEQFIQALLVLKGVDIDSEDFANLKSLGGIKVPADGDVRYLIQELNQQSTQTLIDDQYETVLTICGMPNRNGGSSTSDTGNAVIFRDGWSSAESRAKHTEKMFSASERKFLKVVLRITSDMESSGLNLKLSDIDIRFTRRNYEAIQTKSQVLTTMLSNGGIHPRLAFESCGMFADPERAYTMSEQYAAEQEKKLRKQMEEEAGDEDDENDSSSGRAEPA